MQLTIKNEFKTKFEDLHFKMYSVLNKFAHSTQVFSLLFLLFVYSNCILD